MEVLHKNTVEPLVFNMRDRLETLTDMSTVTNLIFDVKDKEGNDEVTGGTPTTDGMNVICLIDTSGVGWTEDEYHVFIGFDDGAASPYLFAGKFRLTEHPF